MVPGKEIFKKVFTIYGHGSHLGHVTCKMLMNFYKLVPKAYIQNLVENGQVVSEKSKLNLHL